MDLASRFATARTALVCALVSVSLARQLMSDNCPKGHVVLPQPRSLVRINYPRRQRGCHSIVLEKSFGETWIADAEAMDMPAWQWPAR